MYTSLLTSEMLTHSQAAAKEKNQMGSEMPQPQPTPAVREPNPLFESEGPPEEQDPQVPVTVMVASCSQSPARQLDPLETSPFVQQLRDIEASVEADIATWGTKFLSPLSDSTAGASQVPAKRKGNLQSTVYSNATN